jgi:GT2 family glycosyltransferase
MLLRNSDIENIGFLDEGTFLYYEEPILAENLKKIKKKVVLYGPECVIHNHAKTIKTNISQKRRRKVVLNSMDYYLKKYREFNYFERLLCRVVRLVGYFSNK